MNERDENDERVVMMLAKRSVCWYGMDYRVEKE